MDERKEILKEYFKLYVVLNQANRHENERTTLSFRFEIEPKNEIGFFSFLEGSSQRVKMELCRWKPFQDWNASYFSGLGKLEKFCADSFNEAQRHLKLKPRQMPNLDQLQYMKKDLTKKLRALKFKD